MNKEQFIAELRGKIKRLPNEEIENIIVYYTEYFDDAEKDEQEVLHELGSPSKVASQILSDYAFNESTEENKKSSSNKIMLVILAIFAAPIALPLALSVVAILFTIFVVMISVIIVFAVTSLALIVSGIGACIMGALVMVQGPETGCLYIGVGLIIIGIGLLLVICIKNISPNIGSMMKSLTMKILAKFNKGNGNHKEVQ